MNFTKSKKAEMAIGQVIGWTIGLVLLAIVVYAIFAGWNPFKQTVTGVTACESGPVPRTCVVNEDACNGFTVADDSCPPAKPICCAQS